MHFNISLETTLCIPNPLTFLPACSYQPGACASLLLSRQIVVLGRELRQQPLPCFHGSSSACSVFCLCHPLPYHDAVLNVAHLI